MIPGGQCFSIKEEFSGNGFNCTVPVRAGTTVLLVGGDGRGIGSGGWEQMVIKPSNNQACLDSSSPSSTPSPSSASSSPVGGASPTSSGGGGGSNKNNGIDGNGNSGSR